MNTMYWQRTVESQAGAACRHFRPEGRRELKDNGSALEQILLIVSEYKGQCAVFYSGLTPPLFYLFPMRSGWKGRK